MLIRHHHLPDTAGVSYEIENAYLSPSFTWHGGCLIWNRKCLSFTIIYLTRRVSHMKQKMLTLHHHLGLFIGFLVFGKPSPSS
jgi:hypothetical protein